MLSFFREYRFFGIFILIFSAVVVSIMFNILTPKKVLPIYQPTMVNFEMVDSTLQYQSKYHKIADFSMINQNGKTITQDDYKDKIYVADFFFTTCQTICPIMTGHMVKIKEALKDDHEVLLLPQTVPPEIDPVEQLKKYALEHKIER